MLHLISLEWKISKLILWFAAIALIAAFLLIYAPDDVICYLYLDNIKLNYGYIAFIISAVIIYFYILYAYRGLETVITLFIIAIMVASFYVIVHQTQFIKPKISEAIQLMGGAKESLAVYYASHGEFPEGKEGTDFLGRALNVKTAGKYTKQIEFRQNTLVARVEPVTEFTVSMRLGFSDTEYPLFMLAACGYHELPGKIHYLGPALTTLPADYLPFICR